MNEHFLRRSSGNVGTGLGLEPEEALNLRIRSDPKSRISKLVYLLKPSISMVV